MRNDLGSERQLGRRAFKGTVDSRLAHQVRATTTLELDTGAFQEMDGLLGGPRTVIP